MLSLNRRGFIAGGAAAIGMAGIYPAWANRVSAGIGRDGMPELAGNDIALSISRIPLRVDGKVVRGIGINGTVPGPLIRLKEGQNVRLRVTNAIRGSNGDDQQTSIHWHGLLVPFAMDGVPGVSFPGIDPGATFQYEFPIIQSGTYWYHSHSGSQEQDGVYGPIVIEPKDRDPVAFDREHVIVLADHSPMTGVAIFKKLKQMGGAYFNMQRLTLSGLIAGRDMPAKERLEWAKMRMDPADIADVTGSTYTFTVNGYGPFDNWTGLFRPGERVRLRIINAAAQTNFNVRIPDLPMTIVQADGLNVRPVTVDEFQIGVAETFDVVVAPQDRAYTFVSESIDRSGLGRATLAPREGMSAPVPPLRPRPLLTMKDMGMGDMGGMDHGNMTGVDSSGMAMDGPNQPNVAVVRGVDPTAEQNASRDLWKLTGWSAPTDHGTIAVGAAAAAAAASSAPGAASGAMAVADHAAMGHGASGTAAAAGTAAQAQAGSAAGMDHGSMNMRDFSKAPQVKKGPGSPTSTSAATATASTSS